MNIIVTGANGQLGSELRAAAPGLPGHRFIFTDYAELDITDPAAIRRMVRAEAADAIINCAAYTQVDKAEDDEAAAARLNSTAPAHLAEAAKEAGALLIHVSTDYVFGGQGNTPYTEQDTPSPLGVYGRTKLAGEEAIRAVGCRHIILRTAWLYSTHGVNFVKTMRRLMREREELSVVYDQVGSPTYARDLARAILAILQAPGLDEKLGTYHFTNEGVCSWYDFALAIRRLSGADGACRVKPCRSSEFPAKVQRPAFSVLDKAAVKATFGIEIPHWEVSLRECISAMPADS